MSWNNLPVWDKNRPIFFQIGMIISLSIANVAINLETKIPKNNDFFVMDDPWSMLITDVHYHAVPPPPKQSLHQRKAAPILANIVTTDLPVTQNKEVASDIQETDITPGLTHGNETVGTSIEPPKDYIEPTPTLHISEQMPFLTSCATSASEEERRKCTQSAMLSALYASLKYPAIARETGVEGTVIISFVIDKSGKMVNIEIIRDIGAGCGQEAIKVLKSIGNWVPGRHNKQVVNVKFTIPIKFKLS